MDRLEAMNVNEALAWALQHVEFAMMPDADGHYWKACPGCRVIWNRDMQHEENCEYLAAKALVKE